MKKIISVKEMIIILISLVVIAISTNVYATGLVLGGNNNSGSGATISGSEYNQWQNIQADNNSNTNTNTNTNTNLNANKNTNSNNTKVYNTNNSKDLPQTGIEDYNIGILLIICVASAIFAYKKVNDYKNI